MSYIEDCVDVIVIGGGHAGCEAALASAHLGMKTLLFAINLDSIAMMPCNPSIGGTSKGHLVREIDALGGEMGKNIDKTYIQSKMLNIGKGPAVHSLRAQADKHQYSTTMKQTLENQENLKIRQNEVTELMVEQGVIKGVRVVSGSIYYSQAVIIATGTYLNARCIYGDVSIYSGPSGLQAANHLTQSLLEQQIEIYRFKTGTPARIDKRTIDFSQLVEQKGDEKVIPFSFTNTSQQIERPQISCWLTYTNDQTHTIINQNLDRSPLYGGDIKGTGPRYCPSIEDKVVRFADKERHQIFLEPEGEKTNEIYVQGMSTSLPEDVQKRIYRSIKGLEQCEIMRTAYAIEYDCINPLQLKSSLEFKSIRGLYSAGQFNGTSGYEEAAAQGLIAGINAAQSIKGEPALVISRSEGYIGVLIDDLVTKGTNEPYRMMTSRAEYRLLLRQDNADLRLTEKGYAVGLIDAVRYQQLLDKKKAIADEIQRLSEQYVGITAPVQKLLTEYQSTELRSGISLAELLKRPELTYHALAPIDAKRPRLTPEVIEQIEIQIKYEGYISRQMKQVEQFKKMERKLLPETINYDAVTSLRIEAKQKLAQIRPRSIGQASRISGVSPADISVLLVYLEQLRQEEQNG